MILGLLTSCGKRSVDTAIDTETSETATETAEPTEKVSEEDTKDSESVTEESETEAPKQEASNEESTGNHNNDGDSGIDKQTHGRQTKPVATEPVRSDSESATPEPTTPEPVQTISYSPQNVVTLATAKVKAGGKITLTDDLDNLLANGSITQEEYNEYYPYDGAGYYSVFVDSNMAEARDVSGTDHFNSEDDIATYIANMLLLENGDLFLIEYAGTYDYYGKQCYEFRCYRA